MVFTIEPFKNAGICSDWFSWWCATGWGVRAGPCPEADEFVTGVAPTLGTAIRNAMASVTITLANATPAARFLALVI
jgi:hypothetical protein